MLKSEWKTQQSNLNKFFDNYKPVDGDIIYIIDIHNKEHSFYLSECEFEVDDNGLEIVEFYGGTGERNYWFVPSAIMKISFDFVPTKNKREISW